MEVGMISVDKWRSNSQAYFLSHLHADHTVGLTAAWCRGPLYCSRISARLIPCKFPGFDLSLIRVVRVGAWHELSLTTPSSGSATTVCVMAIDAHHCPGSVMYLFRGDFGCMLFTGDFRWERCSEGAEKSKALMLDALKHDTLNVLYLDNTYCSPRYSFPSREAAARKVVEIITSHPNHQVVIGIDTLGKEELLLYISRALNIKICVWPERLQIMHLLGYHENFTTQTSLTRIRAIPRYSFSNETLEGLNILCPTIGIMPSGLPWAAKAMKGKKNVFGSSNSYQCHETSNDAAKKFNLTTTHDDVGCSLGRYNEYIYVVPYSDHSCFSEIREFIELLRPVKLKGIVSTSLSYNDPSYYFGHLCGTKQASWRRSQLDEKVEVVASLGSDDAKVEPESSLNARGKKRRIDPSGFFGVRLSRVSLLRRLSRGAKIDDTEYRFS